jgi:hypothetical protein
MLNPDLPPKVKVIDAGQSGLLRAPKSLTPSWEKNRRRNASGYSEKIAAGGLS